MEIHQLKLTQIEEIKKVISDAFSPEPWNDDWSDELQFNNYIMDLIGNKNSLSLGLYDMDKLVGVSLGRVKHWYKGNEYWIDDLAIRPEFQGRGYGSEFLKLLEKYVKEMSIVRIVLFTNKDIPAYYMYLKNGFVQQEERVFFEKKL